ncbi:MAG: molybdopterin-dependent oxidoreductase [Chloroflexi bacterium]|nr:molybdopterin-dependent oxidoreductase [Chloroflexota bacterium]
MASEVKTAEQVVKTVCPFCVANCGMNVHIKDGRAVKVEGMPEHPINKGRLCPKGASLIDYVYSPDRLAYPMKRRNGKLERITWEEALDIIATRLSETKERYGPKGLAVCQGMSLLMHGAATYSFIRRFTDVYGTPNFFSVDSMCFRPRLMGYVLTTGIRAAADTENARYVILWGHNPNASTPSASWSIAASLRKGTRLAVIDTRKTPLAAKAETHLQPRPGTDCALALGLLHVIIGEGLYDEDFVPKWTVGFDRLAEHVKRYSPEKVTKITCVPADKIRGLAWTFANVKPACILQGTNALDQTTSGVQTARAIAMLQAITGNLDVPGGFITPPRLRLHNLRLLDMMEGKPLGIDRYPLFYETYATLFGEGQGMVLPDTLLTDKPYPIKAMIVDGTNPLRTWPDSRKVGEAFRKLDFLVVIDLFLNETAELADIVLPAASCLERVDLCSDFYSSAGLPYVMARKKVLQSGECRSDMEFWLALAKKMGYENYFPWENEAAVLSYLLEPSGVTLKQLCEEQPGGVFYASMKYRQYEQRGFRTPSGKVELYSETLANLGYDPMPTHREPFESPVSTPELASDYPLILTSGARMERYLHGQLRNLPRLRRAAPKAVAEIHPDTATQYGVREGDTVTIATRRGSIDIEARLSKDILPGVVSIPHGWAEANVNQLTELTSGDPISGIPAFKSMLCKVQKASG